MVTRRERRMMNNHSRVSASCSSSCCVAPFLMSLLVVFFLCGVVITTATTTTTTTTTPKEEEANNDNSQLRRKNVASELFYSTSHINSNNVVKVFEESESMSSNQNGVYFVHDTEENDEYELQEQQQPQPIKDGEDDNTKLFVEGANGDDHTSNEQEYQIYLVDEENANDTMKLDNEDEEDDKVEYQIYYVDETTHLLDNEEDDEDEEEYVPETKDKQPPVVLVEDISEDYGDTTDTNPAYSTTAAASYSTVPWEDANYDNQQQQQNEEEEEEVTAIDSPNNNSINTKEEEATTRVEKYNMHHYQKHPNDDVNQPSLSSPIDEEEGGPLEDTTTDVQKYELHHYQKHPNDDLQHDDKHDTTTSQTVSNTSTTSKWKKPYIIICMILAGICIVTIIHLYMGQLKMKKIKRERTSSSQTFYSIFGTQQDRSKLYTNTTNIHSSSKDKDIEGGNGSSTISFSYYDTPTTKSSMTRSSATTTNNTGFFLDHSDYDIKEVHDQDHYHDPLFTPIERLLNKQSKTVPFSSSSSSSTSSSSEEEEQEPLTTTNGLQLDAKINDNGDAYLVFSNNTLTNHSNRSTGSSIRGKSIRKSNPEAFHTII